MLKIWGRLSSINVRKAVLAAQWLQVPFERVDAGHEFGIVNTPEYLGKNPNGLVPVIEDGGFVLWESNVIVRYLCAKHGAGSLYPEKLEARFDAERWMDWQQTTLNPAGRGAFVQLLRTAPEKRNQDVIAQSIAATEPLLDVLDAHLAQRPFMAGDSFTMADIPIACEIHRWHGLPLQRPERPNLERWYQGILSNPASRGVLDLPLS
ncbi:glutathione S-transferase family protein [Ramlibacter sp. WS9]|uniref:glutathione S-transferase family protein n=1 Tax=Ramlibacter sp. WS9 TaxID=1882741 RepID=UPI001142B842|nr:glutathione S-transferase [Ramlibacter sp. WS9]ROZ74288.1 glutathione S-transferase [Ramlibacter sp. WS9]